MSYFFFLFPKPEVNLCVNASLSSSICFQCSTCLQDIVKEMQRVIQRENI